MQSSPHLGRRLLVACCVLAAVGAIASTQACTNVTNTTAVQCTSEAECLSLGPAFADTTCDKATKTCVKLDVNVGLCARNEECIQRLNGAPAICRKSDKKCVALTTPECPRVLTKSGNAELLDDNAIVIGAFTPTGTVELGTVMEGAVALAQQEISTSFNRGLPPAPGGTASRPLVVVACGEFNGGIEGLLRGANHLVKNVQVPVVVGPVNPSNGGIVASQVFLPSKTLVILPTAIISGLSNLPNPIAPTPLLWRTNFDDQSIATAAAAFVANQLEPQIVAKGTVPVRIAVAADGNLLGRSSVNALASRLRFNNKSAAENAVDGNYLVVNFGDLDDTLNNPNPDARISQAIAQIRSFKPQVVLHAYATRGITPVYFPLESSWPADTPRAYHVGLAPPWNTFGPLFTFLDAIPGGPAARRGRVFGIQNYTYPVDDCDPNADSRCHPPFSLTSQPVQAWLQRYVNKFPEFTESVSPKNQLVWQLYDATYLAAYAIVALRDKPITGENLAATLPQFLKGNPKRVRTYAPEDIPIAFGELAAGNGIDLEGLAGTMDLDPKTASPSYGLEVTCPSIVGGRTVTMGPSGFHVLDSAQPAISSADGKTDLAPNGPMPLCPPRP